MKRIRLLLVLLSFMIGGSIYAQEAGTYYLYNESTGLFLSRGASWGTRSVGDHFGIAFEMTKVSDHVYTLKNVDHSLAANGNKYLGDNLYTDNGTACNYTFAASGLGYTITKGSGYLTASTAQAAISESGSATDASVWQLLTAEQYASKLAAIKDSEAAAIATSMGFDGITTMAALLAKINDSNNWRTIDKTSSVGNADIGGGSGAWTKDNDSSRGAGDTKAANGVFQSWNGSTNIYQTVSSLPSGIYKITVQAFYRFGNGEAANRVANNGCMVTNLYANDNYTQLTSWYSIKTGSTDPNSTSAAHTLLDSSSDKALVEVYAYVGDAGTLRLGIDNRSFMDQDWMVCDNFKLYYYTDQVEDSEITALIATIPAEGTVPSGVYSNLTSLQSALEGAKTIANFNALSSAITAANTLVAPYATYNSVKTAVLALDDDATVFTGSATVDVSAAETAVASATTVEAINAAIQQLRAAGTTFLSAVTVNDGKAFDLTAAYITNPAPWASTDGWTCPVAATPNSTAQAAEFWNKSGVSISQPMASLPAGYYTLKAQAFARTGCSPIYIFAGTGATFSDYANKQELIKKSNSEISTMDGAGTWFNGGNGWNTLTFQNETAGAFTIGLNDEFVPDGSHGDGHDGWLIWRQFQLNYLGTEPVSVLADLYAETLATAEATRDDATYANVQGAERAALLAAIADTPSATSDSYKAKTSALIVATNTFIDPTVVSNWNSYASNYPSEKTKADAISTSIAEGITATSSTTAAEAATATNRLKVAEYNYVVSNYTTAIELGDWTQEGGTAFNTSGGQHWSGNASTGYWEQTSANYQASSWSISFNQTIELPAGDYIFKVAGRHSGSSNMALEVTNADTDAAIGSVNDFPTGGSGKGIATDGTANFTDGTFANSGNGYGFQWRYVPFTLEETTNVKIAVTASAAAQYQWISFCDYTVQAIPSPSVVTIAYDQAKAAAEAAIANATYTNVQGTDRSNLVAAIAADKGETVESIEAATAALKSATTTFTADPASWNNYAYAMSVVSGTLTYASTTKKSTLDAAVAVTVNTASDAATQAAAILTANRLYVESNAMAEGVAGAEDKTSLIGQPNAPASDAEISAWTIEDSDGTYNPTVRTDEQFTKGDGTTGGAYYDGGDMWNSAAYTANYKQNVTLTPGTYLLTVTSRASSGLKTFELYADDNTLEMSKIGASVGTGVFDRGWNDQTLEFVVSEEKSVEIGVNIEMDATHNWYSFSRFRLVQLQATYSRAMTSTGWGTICLPYAATPTNGTEVYEIASINSEKTELALTDPVKTMTAGKPYLYYKSGAAASFTQDNTVARVNNPVDGANSLTGVFESEEGSTPENSYIMKNGNWYRVADNTSIFNLGNNRAYIADLSAITVADPSGARVMKVFYDGETTGIDAIKAGESTLDLKNAYDLQGRKVQNLKRGLYIVNGKKVVVK